MLISAGILGAALGALFVSKKSFNVYRRRSLKRDEFYNASKLEKFKDHNRKFCKLSAKLAKIRMKLSKYNVAGFSEVRDISSMTRREKKNYFQYSFANHRLEHYNAKVEGRFISPNKKKLRKIEDKVEKFSSKLPLLHSSKILPGTYLDLNNNGIMDTRTGINLGLDNKQKETDFIKKVENSIKTTKKIVADNEYIYGVQIESNDQNIDGLGASSNYKTVYKDGKSEVLKTVSEIKNSESYPITVVDIIRNIFGKIIERNPRRFSSEKDFNNYVTEITKNSEKDQEK